ncbi:hypothetical protein AMTRI_Chr05g61140 [Amborella trichopoda]|nr:hypothetical protein AMTR_s00064p00160550 [Amborella trichopoda]
MVGHSLGACLAILSSFDVVANGLNMVGSKPPFPVTAFVFGSPGVGNKEFNDRVKSLPSLRVLHVKNAIDLIPLYPGKFLDYEKTGVDLVVDTRASPYLKDSLNPSDWHNLQALIHVVAGWEGKKGFSLKVPRSVALVNKSCDFLKDECLVPASWWMEKNKGMVRGEGGDWYLSPPIDDDIPLPE